MVAEFTRSIGREFRWGKPPSRYRKVRAVVGRAIRGRGYQVKAIPSFQDGYLNVGCGPNTLDHFINLDFEWRPAVDLVWDITNGLPCPSGQLKGIYTEHCLEHIERSQCQEVLNEFHRILAPGGTARICVPDAGIYLDLYRRHQLGETVTFPFVPEEEMAEGFTPIVAVNRVFRGSGHRYCYDTDHLELMLRKAGFSDVAVVDFREGKDDVLLIDSEYRRVESLYIEAYK